MKKLKGKKKLRKGFTLIEILAVIAIIVVIFLVAIPAILGIKKSINKRELETKMSVLVASAEVYAKNNMRLFENVSVIKVPVRTLIYYGYSDIDAKGNTKNCLETIGCVMNPTDGTSMNDEIITIKKIKSVIQAMFGDTVVEYTLYATFYPNGADEIGKAGNASFIKLGCTAADGGSCSIPVQTIKRDGFVIDGWNTYADATTALSFPSNKIDLTKDTNYYAITHKDAKITFDSNGGTFAQNSTTEETCTIRNFNTSCEIKANPSVSKNGYSKKDGWYTATTGGSTVSLQSVTSSKTVYAQWNKETYKVTLNPNGGTYSSTPTGYTKNGSNYERNYDVESDTFTLPEPGKGGNVFSGWIGTGITTPEKNKRIEKGSTGNRTYTAQWHECQTGYYAAAGATTCSKCPASHPYSAAGSTSINQCYKNKTELTYTDCIYDGATAATAACNNTGDSNCKIVSCSKVYYVLNYDLEGLTTKGNKEYYNGCTTITRKNTDVPLISTNGDSSCNYYTDMNKTGISSPSSYCKDGNSRKVLSGKCSIPSDDTCNQILVEIMLHTGSTNAGDCSSYCSGSAYTGSSSYSNYTVPNVRTDSNVASGRVFFINQADNSLGLISKSDSKSCNKSGATYYTCASYVQSHSGTGTMYHDVKVKNCVMTKAAYDDGTSNLYRIQYTGTTSVYYPN